MSRILDNPGTNQLADSHLADKSSSRVMTGLVNYNYFYSIVFAMAMGFGWCLLSKEVISRDGALPVLPCMLPASAMIYYDVLIICQIVKICAF